MGLTGQWLESVEDFRFRLRFVWAVLTKRDDGYCIFSYAWIWSGGLGQTKLGFGWGDRDLWTLWVNVEFGFLGLGFDDARMGCRYECRDDGTDR